MGMTDLHSEIDLDQKKVKVEAVLVRLKSLKSNIAEIRMQVESIRQLQTGNQETAATCSDCGKEIDQGQEVTIKDAGGNPSRFYHKACFKALWVSQTWRFDYSSPGFLRSLKDSNEK
jgi:uncharacterized protein with PIN domain